jgi:hypothetical protein
MAFTLREDVLSGMQRRHRQNAPLFYLLSSDSVF